MPCRPPMPLVPIVPSTANIVPRPDQALGLPTALRTVATKRSADLDRTRAIFGDAR